MHEKDANQRNHRSQADSTEQSAQEFVSVSSKLEQESPPPVGFDTSPPISISSADQVAPATAPVQAKFDVNKEESQEAEEPAQAKFALSDSSAETPPADGRGDANPTDPGTNLTERFAGVTIHENSDKASQLGAQAYTQGSDIHFAPGKFQPNTNEGKELLGHELTHVVQQKQGRVQANNQRNGFSINDSTSLEAEADRGGSEFARGQMDRFDLNSSATASGPAQMRVDKYLAKVTCHFHELDSTTNKVKSTVRRGSTKVSRGGIVESSGVEKQSKMGAVYMEVSHNGSTGYVKKKHFKSLTKGLLDMQDAAGADKNGRTLSISRDADDNEAAIDDVNTTLDEVGGNTGDMKDELEAANLSTGSEMGLQATAGIAGTGSGLLGMFMAGQAIFSSDSEAADRVEGIFDILSSTSSTVEGLTTSINTWASNGSDLANNTESVGSYAGTVADAINAFKEFIFIIKDVYEAYQEAKTESGTSGQEKFEQGAGVVERLLEGAASTVSTVKGALELAEKSIGGLGEAVPALSIAFSGAQIAMKVYHMVVAGKSKSSMREKKHALRKKYQSTATKTQTSKIGSAAKQVTDPAKIEIRQYDLIAELAALKIDLAREQDPQKKAEIEEDINKKQAEFDGLEELLFVKEMEYINKKRMVRGGFKIGIELVKIAGDISTLSGAGAVAGVPLKAFAAGADVSASIFRKIKQSGRDKAAKNPNSKYNSVFNASKSTDNKKDKRRSDAKFIMKQIFNLPAPGDPKHKGAITRIESFMSAAGAHPKSVYRAFEEEGGASGLNAAMKVLVEAMATRE